MSMVRVALANIRFPSSPAESVVLAAEAIRQAGVSNADIVCFPECYVPGYRALGKSIPPADAAFLGRAWSALADAAAAAKVAVVLGTERLVDGALTATALVIQPDGTVSGFQDKVQIALEEEGLYKAGNGRHIFQVGDLTFGIAICHEGWRYPETVRWASATARRWSSIPTFMRLSQAHTCRRRSRIRPTLSSRRP
jgi:predicted amidohydrolase